MSRPPAPPSRLRVLSIAHTAVGNAAGRLRYAGLASDPELEVSLIVPERWFQFGRWLAADPPDPSGVPVVALPIRLPRAGPASWYLHTYPGLRHQVRRLAPHVVHLWEEPWSLVALQASTLARRAGAALVLEVDQNIHKRLPPPFEWIRRTVLARADMVLPRSPDAAAVVRGGGYAGPTVPIGYGVDRSVFRPGPPGAAAPSATFRLGYAGRLVVEKGLDDVLTAMTRCPEPVSLSIMGEGPHEAALRVRAATAGLAGRVAFQPWAAPEALAAFLRAQDAVVLPTRTTATVKEQFGRIVIEAQACGTPVIGSSSGAIPDVLGEGGWVVPEADPAALAALLARLHATPAEVRSRGTAGLANVEARFTFEVIAATLKHAWQQAHRRRAAMAGTAARQGSGPSARAAQGRT